MRRTINLRRLIREEVSRVLGSSRRSGRLIENSSKDRDKIAHWVWGKDEFMDKSEDELESMIDDYEEEWKASKKNYRNINDYLKDLESDLY